MSDPIDPESTPEPRTGDRAVRVTLNAPFILGYAGIALLVMILGSLTRGGTTAALFSLPGTFDPANIVFYLRLVLYPAGHSGWEHFLTNFTLILLIGPLLEEKYGSLTLLAFSAITAVVTGLVHLVLFDSALLGASGVLFMMIILTSLVRVEKNSLPLTFLLVAILFLGGQFLQIFQEDRISQLAHILGGLCGGVLGIWWAGRQDEA